MKKKLMIGLAALALATGIGAAAGIKASVSNNNAIETKAATDVSGLDDGYYLDGTYVGWTHKNAKKMTLVSGTTYEYDGLFLDGHSDYHFKVFKAENGSVADSDWFNCSSITVNEYAFDYYGNTWYDSCASVKFDNDCRIVKITVNVSTGAYTFDHSAPLLTIGDTTESMPYDSVAKKYVCTIENRNCDDIISIETANGTVLSNYEYNSANNVYDVSETYRIIAGGDITVYCDRWNTETWVSGYSEQLFSFTYGFIDGTISGSTCANPSETIYEGDVTVWDHWSSEYVNLSSSDKEAFQLAVDEAHNRGGIGTALDNKLVEAAGRYLYLSNRYGVSFDGVNAPGSRVVLNSVVPQGTSGTVVSIAIISGLSLLAVAGYFFYRKKHQAE